MSKYDYDLCDCGHRKKKKSIRCKNCVGSGSIEDRTYKFYKDKYNNWWSARIPICRDARKKFNNSDKPKECVNCGYIKHIEVCHIKAVSEFSDDTLIKEINNLNNLIALCPNCHWEYDNGLLKF